MEKTKTYRNIKFDAEIIEKAHNEFLKISSKYPKGKIYQETPDTLRITINDEDWSFDHIEEFLSMVNDSTDYEFDHYFKEFSLDISYVSYSDNDGRSELSVSFPERFNIETIFNIFEKNLKKYRIKKEFEKEDFKIFIGHGRNKQWRDLKDHLDEKHGFKVICYEIISTPGITIKNTLESMLERCSFALLIFTGKDIDNRGLIHARENVIHELGLFQGKLGFDNAIILLEEDVKEFSNIVGLNQIRFSKGNIKEIFGDIVSILNKKIKIE